MKNYFYTLALTLILLVAGGCSHKVVVKNCEKMNESFFICEEP